MDKIANTKVKSSKCLSYDEMKMLELLMNNYVAAQPTPITADEAWAEFCAGKNEFVTLIVDGQIQIGVAPVRGAARFAAARRHKIKFRALQEAQKAYLAIPLRELFTTGGKKISYVAISDMPTSMAEQFMKDVCPCECPSISGETAFYVHDFERWCRGYDPRISIKVA